MDHLYTPVIRTRTAELRGLRELDPRVREKILPLLELTRSRRTSKNPGGEVRKSLESALEIFEAHPFIADLTSLQSQQNGEFESLLDPTNGFEAWVKFAHKYFPPQCIPVVHLLEPFDAEQFRIQVVALRERFPLVALRVPTSYTEFPALLDTYMALTGGLTTTALVLDAGYVTRSNAAAALARFTEMLRQVNGRPTLFTTTCCSSFPMSVVSAGGEDDCDEFPLLETWVDSELRKIWGGLKYGDYSAVHPTDFVGTVTNWVPRVDVMLDDKFYYYRYRRSDGGYTRAAADALRDPRYVPLACWGDLNIRESAAGSPLGRSPSHWIASRINFHISRQVTRLMK